MSRYPFEKLNVQIENNIVKSMCQTTQIEALIEVLPSASTNIVDATESPRQPLAQIEQREFRRNQRMDLVLDKLVHAIIDKKFSKKYNFSRRIRS